MSDVGDGADREHEASPDRAATSWLVPAALDGERVDRAVALLTGLSRAKVSAAVDDGQVLVGGAPARSRGRRVHAGERVEVRPELLAASSDAAPLAELGVLVSVVYEDPDVVVVDKPAGLVVHPGAGNREHTLVHGLLARYPDLADLGVATDTVERPGIVHRLDKGTSGLLMVARTQQARRSLIAQLAERSVERRYTTLVWGSVAADEGVIDAPLGRSDADPTRIAVRAGGRAARTHYRVERRYATPAVVTLLDCRLESGRTHQIRVHLASIGHPVVGDTRYGRRRRQPGDPWPPLAAGRPFLHARTLGFAHPRTGERLSFETDLADDLAATLEPLRP
jgi:23S rRNA pseudouridine1911/1915/1917 synthase